MTGNQANVGGGIYCASNGAVFATVLRISANTALHGCGGAVYAQTCDVRLARIIASDNVASSCGGAIALFGSAPNATANLDGGSWSFNKAAVGGALHVERVAVALAGLHLFLNNSAGLNGGAAACMSGAMVARGRVEVVRNRAVLTEKMDHLARVLNLPGKGYDAVLKWILDFRQQLGVPNTLAEIGVPSDRIADIGKLATLDPSAGGNPIQLTAAEYADIFAAALKGDLVVKKQAA